MTVSELIEELKKLPQDVQVIIQKDSEGNGFSPLECVDADAIYIPETTWYGEVFSTDWSASDVGMSVEEWESFKLEHPRACILAPVN